MQRQARASRRAVNEPDAMHDDDHHRHRAAVAFSNAGHVCTHMFTVLYATAVLHLPLVFNLPYGELLGLSSLGLILFGVAALPAGWLGDRWSTVGMMVIFFVGMGAGAIVTGLATGPETLFVGLTLIGLFASIYHPVGIAWLVASARKRGMALGISGVFGNAGTALAPVFVGAMIDFVSWRAAFIVPGLIAIALGVALFVAWRGGRVSDASADRTPPPTPSRSAMYRVFLVLTFTMSCTGFVYAGLTNTMPKVFELGLGEQLAMSYTEIGLFVGVITGFSSVSGIVGGWLADRVSARAIYLVFWALQIPFLFVFTSMTGVPLLITALLALTFNLGFTAAENMLIANHTPLRWRGIAYGAKFVLAIGVGGLTVMLAGWLFDREGSFDTLYLWFALSAIAATLACVLLPGGRRGAGGVGIRLRSPAPAA